MSFEVKDKVVLITGANRGIGKAIVDSFIEHKARKVYAAVRSLESAAGLVARYGSKVVPIQLDLSDPQSISSAAELATDVEVVVNNAGVLTTTGPLDDGVFDSLKHEMDVNVYGLIHMAQSFAPVLKANEGGVFAQVNSVVSIKTFASFATYSASKAAAYSITQSLREVLGAQGTLVVSVHPGPIDTDMGAAAGLAHIAEPASLVGEALIEAIHKGAFHVFPDTMAKQIGGAYQSFAENVVEATAAEG